MLSRRVLLAAFPLASVAGLMACTSTTVNGVTTDTLNVASFDADVSAGIKLAQAIFANSLVSGALGAATTAAISTIIGDIGTALSGLLTSAGTSATITFDSTSVPAAITSILSDLEKIGGYVQTAVAALGSTLPSDVSGYVSAFTTLLSVIAAIVPLVAAKRSGIAAPTMTETQALAIAAGLK